MSDRTIRVRLEALVDRYRQDMARAGGETRRTGTAVDATTRSARGLGGAVRGLLPLIGAAGLVRAMRRSADAAIAYESSLVKLETQIGLTRQQAKAMGDDIEGLSDTARGPLELADAMFFVASAGLRGSEATAVLEASAKAASIGLGETKVVADLVTSAVNAYGAEVLAASDATDILLAAVREGKAEAPELAGSLGRLLPVASEMGITFDQVGAAVAAMTRTGTGAAEAATQLRQIMVSLMNPTQQSREALAEFGLSAEDLRRVIREDGVLAALLEIRGAVGDNEEALNRIFPNVRALAGVLDLTGANANETVAIFERMTDTVGLTEDAFERWSTSTEASMDRASAAWERARIRFGEFTAPILAFTAEELAHNLEGSLDDFVRRLTGQAFLEDVMLQPTVDFLFPEQALVDAIRAAEEAGETIGLVEARRRVEAERSIETMGKLGREIRKAADERSLEASTARWTAAADAHRASLDGVIASLREQTSVIREQNDPMFALIQAQERFDELLQSGEASSIELAQAALELAEATGAVAEGFDGRLDPAFKAILSAAGLTESQIREVEQTFRAAAAAGDDFDGTYEAQLKVERADAERELALAMLRADAWAAQPYTAGATVDTSEADKGFESVEKDASGWDERVATSTFDADIDPAKKRAAEISKILDDAARNRTSTITVRYRTSGSAPRAHDGAMVHRYHDGGDISPFGPLRHDEVPLIAQTGERVLSRDETDAFHRLIGLLSATISAQPTLRFHDGGMVGPATQAAPSRAIQVFAPSTDARDIVTEQERAIRRADVLAGL